MSQVADIADRVALAATCHRYGVSKLSLFGSAARDELTPDSDIDLLVDFRAATHPTFFTLVQLADEFRELFGGMHEIDLVTRSSIHPLIWRHAKRDLVTLYEEG
jgi:predicted nucleotidyltransferase